MRAAQPCWIGVDVTSSHVANDRTIDVQSVNKRTYDRPIYQSAYAIEQRPVAIHHRWQWPAPGWRYENKPSKRAWKGTRMGKSVGRSVARRDDCAQAGDHRRSDKVEEGPIDFRLLV